MTIIMLISFLKGCEGEEYPTPDGIERGGRWKRLAKGSAK
jgi:hypothetical protein